MQLTICSFESKTDMGTFRDNIAKSEEIGNLLQNIIKDQGKYGSVQ